MPGYKSLPNTLTGDAADQVREAESCHRNGDSSSAVALLEEALAASIAASGPLPGWVCGRLAALYRSLGRYDDEVYVLERFRESQASDDARTRFDARLSKARTIAARKQRQDSGALLSIRESLLRPRRRRIRGKARLAGEAVSAFADAQLSALSVALADRTAGHEMRLTATLHELYASAAVIAATPEQLVDALKRACALPPCATLAEQERSTRYGAAILQLLALHFDENGG
ncbi:MAG TPA: hypothetical protein VGG84_08315 [Gemmatimonadaceae bacterium]